jgi:hypothetical protein
LARQKLASGAKGRDIALTHIKLVPCTLCSQFVWRARFAARTPCEAISVDAFLRNAIKAYSRKAF